jgi:hypothetical protein
MIDDHVLTGYTVQYTQVLFNTMYIFESIIPFQVICYMPSGKISENIRMCPHMSAFAPEFNYRYLCSGIKDYMTKYTWKDGAYNRISIKLIHFKILE